MSFIKQYKDELEQVRLIRNENNGPIYQMNRLDPALASVSLKQSFMNNSFHVSEDIKQLLQQAIDAGKHWLVYNADFFRKEELHFAASKGDGIDFIIHHQSPEVNHRLIYFKSVKDAINNLITKNVSIMNEKNFEYLKENLKYAGFADKLNDQLEAQLKKQQPEFTLKLETEVNKQPVKAELYFKKSNETDMYFFNKYDIEMKNEKEGQQLAQTFYINQSHGVTLKEAYNLLNGRAVHKELENKEGEKYKAWIKLDFSDKDDKGNFKRQQFHENYGYDINEALGKYPIKELLDEKQKEELIKSLQKGNVQIVAFEKNGKSEKLYVEANPQFKSINVYDTKMQRIQSQDLAERYGQGMNGKENQTAKESSKQTNKQDKGEDDSGGQPKQKVKRNKRQGIS